MTGSVRLQHLAQRLATPETYFIQANPIGPRACFDEGKRAAQTLFFDYHRVHGVEIKSPAIQHLWATDAGERPDGLKLHRAGVARRSDHHLWLREQTVASASSTL